MTVGVARDDAGHVRAVAVGVGEVAGQCTGLVQVGAGDELALEVGVALVHAGVDDRDDDTHAGRLGPRCGRVRRTQRPLVRGAVALT